MTATLGPLLVDAADPSAMAAFWSAALGGREQERLLRFRVQRAPKTVKNRVHLDVAVGPEGRGVDRLLRLGARVLADHLPDWVTLADVEGNEFCVFPGRSDGDAAARVFAVCTDSGQPEQLAAWWAARVGARIGPGPDQTPRWLHGCAGWPGLIWKFVRVDDARITPNRWWPTLAESVDDLMAAGALMRSEGTLVDPQGNEFSADPGCPAG